MPTLEHAIALAAKAHEGQLDQSGQPYILHPLRVMLSVATVDERIAAVLHDVVEDTRFTLEDLLAAGFSTTVVDAVEALTKRPGEHRMEAAVRAAANPIAKRVKLADNADNMDPSRMPSPTPRDLARLKEYQAVRAFLLGQSAG